VQLNELFRWQTTSGDLVTFGDVAVRPQSTALSVHWPNGGWVWNRPVAVMVERGPHPERIPIVDVTRLAQLGLYGFSVMILIGMLVWLIQQRRAA
jgi:hypothetical protein